MSNTDEIRWQQRLDKRSLLSHTYREEIALQAETLIKKQYHPMLRRLRATLEKRRTI